MYEIGMLIDLRMECDWLDDESTKSVADVVNRNSYSICPHFVQVDKGNDVHDGTPN